jgi:hypothetical protein
MENAPVMLEKTYEFFTKQAGFNRDLTFTDRAVSNRFSNSWERPSMMTMEDCKTSGSFSVIN